MSRARSAVLIAAVAAAAALTFAFAWNPWASAPPASPGACERLAVPAYFSPPAWSAATGTSPPPGDMILDISGMGAGTAPQADFRAAVGAARAAGVIVLGYISTEDGHRPLAQDEAEVRDYAAWYGVRGVFLDRVTDNPAGLGYYRALAGYIRARDPGGQLWLNPGDYPDRSYMSLGDVVMTFEGTYAQYVTAPVPAWVRDYPPSRFAHTVYSASAADLGPALRLAAVRGAGHVYVTDGSGANPYQALPGYWAAEAAAASSACGPGTSGAARAG